MTKTHPGRGTALDLFAGAGGLSLGLEAGGFDIRGSVDREPQNALVHHEAFPYGRSAAADIAGATGDQLRRLTATEQDEIDLVGFGQTPTALGQLTLLAGGPPCQGFSSMGRQDVNDPRSQLLHHFARLIVEMQPRYALAENVPGLLTNPDLRSHLDLFLETLTRGGYSVVTPRILKGVDFGVPQKRERVFFLIYRQGETAPIYPEATHRIGGDLDLFLKPTPNVRDAIGDIPDLDLFPELWESDILHFPAARRGSLSQYAMAMRGLSNDPDDLSYARDWDPDLLTGCQLTRHTEERIEIYRRAARGKMIPGDKLHKLDWEGQAPTLRAGSGAYTAARPVHPGAGRVITVREAARLHSIPDWFLPHRKKIHGHRQIGNSVPPLMARAVAHEIRKAAGIAAVKPDTVLPAMRAARIVQTGKHADALLGEGPAGLRIA